MVELPKPLLESALITMLSAVKSMSLYPREHPSVQAPLKRGYELISDLLRMKPSLTLGIVEEVLVFEGSPLYSSQVAIREFQKRFEQRGISAVEILDGLSLEEFAEFIKLLGDDPAAVKETGIGSALKERGVRNIVSQDLREVYNNTLSVVGEVLNEVRMGRIPEAGKAKEAVADLKRSVLHDQSTMLALTMIKSYDTYLFNHSVNVSVLALALAQALAVPDDDLAELGLAGLLHDVGKTLTPKTIILKPGGLNPEEWEVMRQHSERGAEVVAGMEGVSELVVRIVREHHVNFDLNGYPCLEPGQQVHPYSKIVTVADCYDAITTLRPYQKPFEPREAMRVMESLSGTVIDPKYFEKFVRLLGIYPIGSLVRLDTNEVAVVLETYSEAPLTPKIRIVFSPEGKSLSHPVDLDLSKPDAYPGEPRFIVSTVDPLLYNVEVNELM